MNYNKNNNNYKTKDTQFPQLGALPFIKNKNNNYLLT